MIAETTNLAKLVLSQYGNSEDTAIITLDATSGVPVITFSAAPAITLGAITATSLAVGGGYAGGSGADISAAGALSANSDIISDTMLQAGKSGAAGVVRVYPSTAAQGYLDISVTDQTGNTEVSLVVDAMAAARSIHLPDPGAEAYLVMSTAQITLAEADRLDGAGTTVVANKVVVADGDKDIVGLRNLWLGVGGATGFAGSLIVSDGGNPGNAVTLTYADMALIDGLTPGTAAASKALTLDANLDVTGVRNATLTGTLTVAGSVLTGWSDTADGTIPAYRLVILDASGDTVVGTVDSLNVIGINTENDEVLGTETVYLGIGKRTVVAGAPVKAGYALKCADNGRVCHHINSQVAGATIKQTAAGSEFTNQPANDQLTIESTDAGDTAVDITIIGTTTGGNVVVLEVKATNGADGTTPVDSVKVDWGEILAVKKAVTTGDIVIKEKSAGLTVCTVPAASTSLGVNAVAAADQGAHNGIPTAQGSDTTTKKLAIQYTATDGSTVAYQCVALTDATPVAYSAAALLVTEVYGGDLEAARTATVKVRATEDGAHLKVGKALADIAAAASGSALINP